MSNSQITQCPHCRTSFRVSLAQLSAAKGAVRCGACLHVFNARQHLLGEGAPAGTGSLPPANPAPRPLPPASSGTSSAPRPAAPAPAPAQVPAPATVPAPAPQPASPPAATPARDDTLWIHDDLDLDSLDLDEELAKLEREEMQLSREFLALEKAPKPAERLLGGDTPGGREAHDEGWAEELLRAEARPAPASIAELEAASDSPDDTGASASHSEPAGTSRSEPRLSARDDDDEPAIEAIELQALDSPAVGMGAAASADAQPPGRDRREPSLADDDLLQLSNEPLRLTWEQQRSPWGRRLAWTLLNLLAAGGLLAQYASYNFAELARQDRYRPWFEAVCPQLGCSLPSKVDIAQIRSNNLIVRAHPQHPQALVVDAILYNRASFAQPFPLLEIRFADLNGQLLASRRFRPAQYLAGELAGQSQMPPHTPIRIALEILDPGPQAVNYSLNFQSPE